MSEPVLLAWARIRPLEVESVQSIKQQCQRPWKLSQFSHLCQETEQKYQISLGKTNCKKKTVTYINYYSTTLCEASAETFADTIRDYIKKEGLMEAVLRGLDLHRNPNMSHESLGRIVESLVGYQIHSVNLSLNPHLGDSMVATIQPLLEAKDSRLTELNLAKCGPGLTVAGLKWLVKAASKSRLRLLDISYISIIDESELLEQVLELPMIEELAFRFCDLSPEDVRTIAEGLPWTSVKSLHLAGNTFGSQGLVHLASKLSESMVEELDLSGVGIEAKCEGLSQLAGAWVKRPFPKLYLRNNPMGQTEVMNFIKTLQTTLIPSGPVDATWMGNVDFRRCC